MPRRHSPQAVLPRAVVSAVGRDPFWFVIGGHAVRCFSPYRPSNDVDFGVGSARDLATLLSRLEAKGHVSVLERTSDTVHLQFDHTDVSIFVLSNLEKHTEGQALTATGVLATKLHAILDRGTRRDFFDLYVMLAEERLGLVDCFAAMRNVYAREVNEGLLLRAVTYFDDAEVEAALPGEGRGDWDSVKRYFMAAAGALLTPPMKRLSIQSRVVDVTPDEGAGPGEGKKGRRRPGARRKR